MKKTLCLSVLMGVVLYTSACPVCERNQPELLKGITHGPGPESQWDYVIISGIAIVVLVTLFFSIKWLIHPGEKSNNHIKRYILNDN